MTMQPLTISAGSAMSPCSTTSWYQAAKSWARGVIRDSGIPDYYLSTDPLADARGSEILLELSGSSHSEPRPSGSRSGHQKSASRLLNSHLLLRPTDPLADA